MLNDHAQLRPSRFPVVDGFPYPYNRGRLLERYPNVPFPIAIPPPIV